MQAWLHLSSPAPADGDWSLTWWRADGEAVQGGLEQAARDLARLDLTLLLPAEAASHHTIEVPARSGRWLRQAIHSALEERLLDDLDALLLARGPLLQRRHCRLFVVRRDWLRQVLARLARHGLVPGRIHIDADCLPGEGALALRCAGRWLIGGGAPLRLALSDQARADLEARLPDALEWRDEAPWPLLAEGSRSAIDLRQDEFARDSGRRLPWRTLALLAALGLAAQLGLNIGQRLLLEQRADALAQANLAAWQQRYPDQDRVVDLARQVRARMQQAGQPHLGLAHSLDSLARLWKSSGGVIAQVGRLDYQAGEGWTLRVRAPAFADLERLREGLVRQGLIVLSDSAVRDPDGVSARLQIKD
ncbi:type II secretion system protein GspL [Pseudomonas sp. TCU-HL1]|uniref:type II secretion system protein GspL n=1 Tax=Pseudomonas sp. TCU-HL1 TaxID=1856685 RepID=UPI00083E1422|nr:type II secretion system protein GspL [Pseudomonas sp. TCU-HL1]AOE87595.1 general secretion pathway protein GspL [Pseudomonas sp. TCU-HL1]